MSNGVKHCNNSNNSSNSNNCINAINCKKYKNCNICYNCNCHKFPGHFMSVQRLHCRNNLINFNFSFSIN